MRALHFRAWDLVKKEWIHETNEMPFSIIGEVTVFDMINQYRIENYNDIEITQSTGLRDKNAKEIFEGDRVKHSIRRIWKTKEHISVVIWDATWCTYYLNDGISKHRMRDDNNFEVIGNIYENNITK